MAHRERKQLNFSTIVDFSLSKQGISFVTLTHMKEPTQYELFIETVYCVGFLYIRKALLQCALRIFLSYPDMRHEKVKLRKCRNKTLKNHDMNGYVSFEKWASSNWQGVRFFKSLCGRFSL